MLAPQREGNRSFPTSLGGCRSIPTSTDLSPSFYKQRNQSAQKGKALLKAYRAKHSSQGIKSPKCFFYKPEDVGSCVGAWVLQQGCRAGQAVFFPLLQYGKKWLWHTGGSLQASFHPCSFPRAWNPSPGLSNAEGREVKCPRGGQQWVAVKPRDEAHRGPRTHVLLLWAGICGVY